MGNSKHALALAALIYGLFSSPTPDTPGLAEYAVLSLIIFACLPVTLPHEKWVLPTLALLGYGFTVPFLTGALNGNAGPDMLRDVIAFSALALPVLLARLYPSGDRNAQKQLLCMLLGIGLLFSIRYLASIFTPLGFLLTHDLLYLANSPLVAFSAAWLLLYGSFAETSPGRALALCLLGIIPLFAMIGMMQRATVMLLALAWCAGFTITLVKHPHRALIVALVLTLIAILLWPVPALIVQSLADKTMAVGWNARGAEFAALMHTLNQNPLTAVFGAGWGSIFKSPAVGDLWVRFSHAMLTSLLWKTGWPGLLLGITAIGTLVTCACRRLLRHDMVTLAALILPLLPALFLYGSYKSLCFGLLLLGVAQLQWTRRQPG